MLKKYKLDFNDIIGLYYVSYDHGSYLIGSEHFDLRLI